MSERSPTTARHIAATLRSKIASGEIPEGARLPAVRELAERYNTTRNTAAKAVLQLQAEGLVVSRHGSGVYVRTAYPVRILGPDRYARSRWQNTTVQAHTCEQPTSASITQQGGQSQTVNLVDADEETARALGLPQGAPVYERARVVDREGEITHTMNSYYRVDDVADTPIVDARPGIAGRGGGFQILTDLGLPPEEIQEDISARMPTPEEIIELDIPPGEPVVVVHRTTFTTDGRAIEYARGVHRASRFAWSYRYAIPD